MRLFDGTIHTPLGPIIEIDPRHAISVYRICATTERAHGIWRVARR